MPTNNEPDREDRIIGRDTLSRPSASAMNFWQSARTPWSIGRVA